MRGIFDRIYYIIKTAAMSIRLFGAFLACCYKDSKMAQKCVFAWHSATEDVFDSTLLCQKGINCPPGLVFPFLREKSPFREKKNRALLKDSAPRKYSKTAISRGLRQNPPVS
jgi:hypothetical protein